MADQFNVNAPPRAEIGLWLSRGWDWFVEDWPTQIVYGLFAAVLISVGNVFLTGPVLASLAFVTLKKARGKPLEVGDFFEAFRFFLWAFVSGLVIFVLVIVGLVFLIVPGLVVATMYMFTYHFLVDENLDFWQAMEASRQFVSRDYLGFTFFFLLLGIFNFAGMAFFGIGILLTLPVTSLALAAAYEGALEAEPPSIPPTHPAELPGPIVIE